MAGNNFGEYVPQKFHEHDTRYKKLFGHKIVFVDLLKSLLDPRILDRYNLDSLVCGKTEFNVDNKVRCADLIWMAERKDREGLIVFPTEFQSYVHEHMAARMLTYCGLALEYANHMATGKQYAQKPELFQMLLHNTGKTESFQEQMLAFQYAAHNGIFPEFFLHADYNVIDMVNFQPPYDANNQNNLVRLIHNIETLPRLDQQTAFNTLKDTVRRLAKILPENACDLHEAFITWLGSKQFRKAEWMEEIKSAKTMQEVNAMIQADLLTWEDMVFSNGEKRGLKKGWLKGREEGRKEGFEKGEEKGHFLATCELFMALLKTKFLNIPKKVEEDLCHMAQKDKDVIVQAFVESDTLEEFCQKSGIEFPGASAHFPGAKP